MPSFAQACLAAVIVSWSAREFSPDLLQCVPAAYETLRVEDRVVREVKVADPVDPVQCEPPTVAKEPIPATPRARVSDSESHYAVLRSEVGFGLLCSICYLLGAFTVLCPCRCCRRSTTLPRLDTRDVGTQTLSLFESRVIAAESRTVTPVSSPAESLVGSPARVARGRKGVYGGFSA